MLDVKGTERPDSKVVKSRAHKEGHYDDGRRERETETAKKTLRVKNVNFRDIDQRGELGRERRREREEGEKTD